MFLLANKKEKELAQCPAGEFCINEIPDSDSNNLKSIIKKSILNSDLGLSKDEGEKIYPKILHILDGLKKEHNTVDKMDEIIKNQYAKIIK